MPSKGVIWVEGLLRKSCEREIIEKVVENIRSFLKRTVICINVDVACLFQTKVCKIPFLIESFFVGK